MISHHYQDASINASINAGMDYNAASDASSEIRAGAPGGGVTVQRHLKPNQEQR